MGGGGGEGGGAVSLGECRTSASRAITSVASFSVATTASGTVSISSRAAIEGGSLGSLYQMVLHPAALPASMSRGASPTTQLRDRSNASFSAAWWIIPGLGLRSSLSVAYCWTDPSG